MSVVTVWDRKDFVQAKNTKVSFTRARVGINPSSEGQLLYSQSAISIYMTAGANPGQPFLPGNPSRDPD